MQNNTAETPIQQASRVGREIRSLATDRHAITSKTIRFPRGNAFRAICSCGFQSKQEFQAISAQLAGLAHLQSSQPTGCDNCDDGVFCATHNALDHG